MNTFQNKRYGVLGIFFLVLLPALTVAQPQKNDPFDPGSPIPKASYSSSFESYLPYQELRTSWINANANAMQSGHHAHHQGHGQEAPTEPAPSSEHQRHAPSSSEAPPMPAHSGGHHH